MDPRRGIEPKVEKEEKSLAIKHFNGFSLRYHYQEDSVETGRYTMDFKDRNGEERSLPLEISRSDQDSVEMRISSADGKHGRVFSINFTDKYRSFKVSSGNHMNRLRKLKEIRNPDKSIAEEEYRHEQIMKEQNWTPPIQEKAEPFVPSQEKDFIDYLAESEITYEDIEIDNYGVQMES